MTLKELAVAIVEKKYSNIPVHARPVHRYSDKTANELTKAIIAYCEFKGYKAWRQATEGRYLKEKYETNVIGHRILVSKGKYIPRSNQAKGAGDVTVLMPPHGRMISVEVKIGSDRQRPDQKKFQMELEGIGGVYILTKSWDDFILQFQKHEPSGY